MKRSKIFLVLVMMIMAVFVFTGCTAVITDDEGETYEIPMDEAEDFAREYISEEMQLYVTEQIANGYTLADALGLDEAEVEAIIREEVRNAITEEIKNGDLMDMVLSEVGISTEDVAAQANELGKKADEAAGKVKETVEKAGEKAEEKVEEKKTEGKAVKEDAKVKAEEAQAKADEAVAAVAEKAEEVKAEIDEKKAAKDEEKKADAKADSKAEDKKDEGKADAKADEKKEDAKADDKVEDKRDEGKDEAKDDAKADEKKDDAKTDEKKEDAKADDKKSDDYYAAGSPWIDSNLKRNVTKDMKTSEKDDFALHVNKDWILDAKIKEGRSTVSALTEVEDIILEKGKSVLTDKSLKSKDAQNVKAFYESVLNWDARNKLGLDPIEPAVLDMQKAQSVEDINALLTGENRLLYGNLAGFGNTASLMDANINVLYISETGLFLGDPAEYEKRTQLGDLYYDAYKGLVTGMLKRLGYNEAQADETFEKAIEFESLLAKKMYTSADKMSSEYTQKMNNPMNEKEVQKLVKNYPLLDIIEAYGYKDAKSFNVTNPAYLKDMDSLYTDDNVEGMRAYFISHVVSSTASILDEEAYELFNEAVNKINGSQGREPDEDIAYELTSETLSVPFNKAFLEKYDSTQMKEDVTALIKDVIAYYKKMLEKEEWLSEETRDKAIEKLDNITINAIYPEKWEDYSSLSMKEDTLFENSIQAGEFGMKLNAEKTDKPVDRDIWDINILETNAYYNPADNSINIIRGLMESPIYSEDLSREELLGGIGMIIGHEISHAFDSSGAQYDKDGNVANWWTEEDMKKFMERDQKLVDYYNNITVFEGENVRGNNIDGEAVADMGGFKCMLGIAAQEKDFDYKKFFEHYAEVWKVVTSEESEYHTLTQDPHPLCYLRVNAVVQQFDEFYEAYDIKEGDKMYLAPEDRVCVW